MTPEQQWSAVDDYLADAFLPRDLVLEAAQKASVGAGLPAIAVSPLQGKFLHLLALAQGARNILEIGTRGGYSTIWLARALPAGGRLVTLEFEPRHAEVARENLARSGLDNVVEVRLGRALDTLPGLAAEGRGPFDFVFLDADKDNYPGYFEPEIRNRKGRSAVICWGKWLEKISPDPFGYASIFSNHFPANILRHLDPSYFGFRVEWALKLSRRGTVIIADNVVRKGAVVDSASVDPLVQGVRRFHERVAAEPRVSATTVQTVGCKGYDGFTMIVVNEPAPAN